MSLETLLGASTESLTLPDLITSEVYPRGYWQTLCSERTCEVFPVGADTEARLPGIYVPSRARKIVTDLARCFRLLNSRHWRRFMDI